MIGHRQRAVPAGPCPGVLSRGGGSRKLPERCRILVFLFRKGALTASVWAHPQRWLEPQWEKLFSTPSRLPPSVMAAAAGSSLILEGGLPPPLGFRPDMGYEGEGEYEHQGGDNSAS